MRKYPFTKPTGSLGRLEKLSIQLAGITGNPFPKLHDKVIITIAGDHGVVAEGVSAYPQEDTLLMVVNFLASGAGINVLTRLVGARVVIADMGVTADMPAQPGFIQKKVAYSIANMAHGPAIPRPPPQLPVFSPAYLPANWLDAAPVWMSVA